MPLVRMHAASFGVEGLFPHCVIRFVLVVLACDSGVMTEAGWFVSSSLPFCSAPQSASTRPFLLSLRFQLCLFYSLVETFPSCLGLCRFCESASNPNGVLALWGFSDPAGKFALIHCDFDENAGDASGAGPQGGGDRAKQSVMHALKTDSSLAHYIKEYNKPDIVFVMGAAGTEESTLAALTQYLGESVSIYGGSGLLRLSQWAVVVFVG